MKNQFPSWEKFIIADYNGSYNYGIGSKLIYYDSYYISNKGKIIDWNIFANQYLDMRDAISEIVFPNAKAAKEMLNKLRSNQLKNMNFILLTTTDKTKLVINTGDKLSQLKRYRRINPSFKGSIIKRVPYTEDLAYIFEKFGSIKIKNYEDLGFYKWFNDVALAEILQFFKEKESKTGRYSSSINNKLIIQQCFPSWFIAFLQQAIPYNTSCFISFNSLDEIWRNQYGIEFSCSDEKISDFFYERYKQYKAGTLAPNEFIVKEPIDRFQSNTEKLNSDIVYLKTMADKYLRTTYTPLANYTSEWTSHSNCNYNINTDF